MYGEAHGGQSTYHGGNPAMSKPNKGKAIHFENPGRLSTVLETWGGGTPWSNKHRGLGPREQANWLKAQVFKAQMEADTGTLPGDIPKGDIP